MYLDLLLIPILFFAVNLYFGFTKGKLYPGWPYRIIAKKKDLKTFNLGMIFYIIILIILVLFYIISRFIAIN